MIVSTTAGRMANKNRGNRSPRRILLGGYAGSPSLPVPCYSTSTFPCPFHPGKQAAGEGNIITVKGGCLSVAVLRSRLLDECAKPKSRTFPVSNHRWRHGVQLTRGFLQARNKFYHASFFFFFNCALLHLVYLSLVRSTPPLGVCFCCSAC